MAVSAKTLKKITRLHFVNAGVDINGVKKDFDFKGDKLVNEVGKISKVGILTRLFENSVVAKRIKDQLTPEVIKELILEGKPGTVRFHMMTDGQVKEKSYINVAQQVILTRAGKPVHNPLTDDEIFYFLKRFDASFPRDKWFSSFKIFEDEYNKLLEEFQTRATIAEQKILMNSISAKPTSPEDRAKQYLKI